MKHGGADPAKHASTLPGSDGPRPTGQPLAQRPRGLWRLLSDRIDPAGFRPRLAPDVELKEFRLRWGNDYAMIRNPRDLIHYRLEPDEVELVRLMDGSRTVKEIVVDRFRRSGELDLDGVVELVRELNEGGFWPGATSTRTGPSAGP